jgi:hypothetical protein
MKNTNKQGIKIFNFKYIGKRNLAFSCLFTFSAFAKQAIASKMPKIQSQIQTRTRKTNHSKTQPE